MMESEIAVGQRRHSSPARTRRTRRRSRASSLARSRPAVRCRCCAACCCRRSTARSSSPRRTWSSRSARGSRRVGRGEGAVVVPGKLLADLVRLLPADEVSIEYRRRGRRPRRSRPGRTPRGSTSSPRRTSRGCRPSTCRCRRSPRRRCSRRSTASRGRASRDESRPVLTGILVRFEGRQARDGGDRLVPALRQGDRARARRPRARGDHPGAGAGRARPARGRRRDVCSSASTRTTSSSARETPG